MTVRHRHINMMGDVGCYGRKILIVMKQFIEIYRNEPLMAIVESTYDLKYAISFLSNGGCSRQHT